jgi:hypothetical protein
MPLASGQDGVAGVGKNDHGCRSVCSPILKVLVVKLLCQGSRHGPISSHNDQSERSKRGVFPQSIINLNNVSFVLLGSSMDRHQKAGDRPMRTEYHRCPLDVRRRK